MGRAAIAGSSLLLLPTAGVAAPPPAITFEEEGVVAAGMTAGGQVVWLSIAREIEERTATIVRRHAVTSDDDRDGAVRLELDRKVPFQSIWVAVDLATGIAAVATPEGYPLRGVELPPSSVRAGGAQPDWIEDTRSYVEVLLVRPGSGAWGASAGDGSEADDDGEYDGRLRASLDRLRAIDDSPRPPDRFNAGDVLVVIDPNQMVIGLRQLAQVPQ